jgi:hypothetical protein
MKDDANSRELLRYLLYFALGMTALAILNTQVDWFKGPK